MHRRRKFSALADGEHSDAQSVGDSAAKQEAPGVDTGDEVRSLDDRGEGGGDRGEPAVVGQHRGQVPEQHTGFGEVGHVAGQRD